jgi:hypothetical protein
MSARLRAGASAARLLARRSAGGGGAAAPRRGMGGGSAPASGSARVQAERARRAGVRSFARVGAARRRPLLLQSRVAGGMLDAFLHAWDDEEDDDT